MLIQTFPPRLILRVIAIRAASICRLDTQPASSAFRPYSPNCTVVPPFASPAMRPRCCLRCLTRFGINMVRSAPVPSARALAPARLLAFAWRTVLPPATGRRPLLLTLGFQVLGRAITLGHDLALVDPALHADPPEGRAGLVQAVIDVGA